VLQTADGASSDVTDLLQQQRGLALQSMNGTYNAQDRSAMNAQYQQLTAEIDHIATSTSFNDAPLMANLSSTGAVQNGNPAPVNINTGNGNTSIQLGNFSTSATGGVFGNSPFNTTDISSDSNASNALNSIDSAIGNISDLRANFGATQNSLTSTIDNISNNSVNLSANMSQIQDTDYARAISVLSQEGILQHAGVAMLAQSNHNEQNVMTLLR
jgi:flagellin